MTLNEMRALVRCDLRDEDENNYRWNDDELNRHILHAVKDVSEAVPNEQTIIIPVISGSRELDVTGIADRIAIRAVEYPLNFFPKRYRRFSIWKDMLTIIDGEAPAGGNACIYYEKMHAIDDSSSSIPQHLEELVICGACGYAAIEWAAYSVNRVNIGGNETPADFLRLGKAKIAYFRSELKRVAGKNRLHINRLYKPQPPPPSKITDYGV